MDPGIRDTPGASGGANGSGQPTPPPPPRNLAELMDTQTALLRQLVQGQQAMYQLLQQQHHHLDRHNVHQPQVMGYRAPDEEIGETKDIYSDSLMPPSRLPMKLKDHQVKCRGREHGPSGIYLTGWEITCTEFVPRGKRQTGSIIHANTVQSARTHSSVREEISHTECTIPDKGSIGTPVMTSVDNQRPGGPSDTNRCFICESPTHFIRDWPQAQQQNQDQGSRQGKKDKCKKRRNKHKRQDE